MDQMGTAFTREKLADAIDIWNRSAVTLLDIRHNLISQAEPLVSYRLPASAFLYTRGERAEVCLGDTFYNTERFGLFHGCQGAELTITPRCRWLEYYMVLYKAGEPPSRKGEWSKLRARTNPFRQQYGFAPSNPLFFAEQLRRMYDKWKGPTPLNLFYGKTAFYQLVYEVYEELDRGNIDVLEPDIVAVAKRYLEKHFKDNIAIAQLCDSLGVSHSHFHRSFKQQTGSAPQEYLIKTRLRAAMELLKQGDSSIREIAVYCGFPDEINFYRQFVKHIGVAPSVYKRNLQRDMSDCAMENSLLFPYNWESQVSLGELKGKGATYMFKQMSGKAVAAAALSLMMLMSACGTAPVNSGGADSAPSSAVSSQVKTEVSEPVEEGTRIISTVMGDVEVPVNPKSIAGFGLLVGDMIALGLTPVCGNNEARLYDGFLTEENYAYVQIDDYEGILQQSPDLIVVSYIPEPEAYDKLSAIAPTVVIEAFSLTMPERLALTGNVLGQDEAASKTVSDFQAKADACRAELEAAGIIGKTVTVMEGNYLFGEKYGRGADTLYNYLGFTAPEKLQAVFDSGEMYLEISMEVLADYCGDYIVRSVYSGTVDLSENAVWNSISAVANGHVIEIDFTDYYSGDIYTSAKQLEVFTKTLLALNN